MVCLPRCCRKHTIALVTLLNVTLISFHWMVLQFPRSQDESILSRENKERMVVDAFTNTWTNSRDIASTVQPTNQTKAEVDIVVGIPTIKRVQNTSYIAETLTSLLNNRGKLSGVVFVVYIAEADKDRVEFVTKELTKKFSLQIESGLIHIISPPANLYPEWNKVLRLTLGDPYHQVKWRSKQNLDQAYLMTYAHSLHPKYYLMLEDDVSSSTDYLQTILRHAESVWRDDLLFISYCKWGAIGKLFEVGMLPTIASYLRIFWNNKPLDWLIFDLLRTLVCRYPADKCEEDVKKIKIDYATDLFTHNGKVSSLLTEKPVHD